MEAALYNVSGNFTLPSGYPVSGKYWILGVVTLVLKTSLGLHTLL